MLIFASEKIGNHFCRKGVCLTQATHFKLQSLLQGANVVMNRNTMTIILALMWQFCHIAYAIAPCDNRVSMVTYVTNMSIISAKCHNILEISPLWMTPSEQWTWWRHQMETFSARLAICAGNSPVPGEFPTQRPVTRSFDVFFDLRLNKWLSKQSWGWWFETPSHPLSRQCNGNNIWNHRN